MDIIVKILVLGTLVLGVQNTEIESSSSSSLPVLDEWWGPEEMKSSQDTSIRPFTIKFDEQMICDVKERLKNHRKFTPPLEGAAFTYGFNTDTIESWITYWRESYNFTEREAYLNQFPQFKTNIQGLDIHFIHVKPEVPEGVEVVPLLMLHGYPGSVREFYDAIPIITAYCEKRGFAVELIVPSLPGFGFSDGAVRRNCGGYEIAVILRNLMHRLGFPKFYIQAGDWGALISNSIVTLFPDEVLGYHTNFPVSFAPGTLATWFIGTINESLQSLVVKSSLAERLYPLLTILKGIITESGYLHIQATKPDTIGVAMSDSPSGLLAFLLQNISMASRAMFKYRDDGGIDTLYSRDSMIDNLMIYWANNAFNRAVRIYAEGFNTRTVNIGSWAKSSPVPVCTIHAADELLYQSPTMLRFKFPNLINSTVLETGGHFLALELPETFSENVMTALIAFRDWHAKKACNQEL